MKLEVYSIAKICHQANKALCEAFGDYSQIHWAESEEWQKQSAIAGVTYLKEHPDATPESLHQNWMQDKLNAGWKYGTIKCTIDKIHPCLVPYAQLPKDQQIKDTLFLTIVRALVENVKTQA